MKLVKLLFITVSRFVGRLFFDSRLLRGRWFDGSTVGWRWMWRSILFQKVLGFNRSIPWPVSHRNHITNARNLRFSVDDMNNFQLFGCYFQNFGETITIGEGTYIGPNVGLITANHDPRDPRQHLEPAPVSIGRKCWIGMNTVVLPGVVLGDATTVGAGSVVTKSFPHGSCVIAGNPARLLKEL